MWTAESLEAGLGYTVALDPDRNYDFGPLFPVARPTLGDGWDVRQGTPTRQGVETAPNLGVVPGVVGYVEQGPGTGLTRPEPDDLCTNPGAG